MRIGLLTGGGDCPGLNAAIHAIVRTALAHDDTVIGFRHGWRGVVQGEVEELDRSRIRGILERGGTILGTAGYHPHQNPGAMDKVVEQFSSQNLDAMIVLGGDGTLNASVEVSKQGIPIVGLPKTIDNDVWGTERCIGFDTAVATATDAIDRVHTTGESHDRIMIVEVMGRVGGWLAIYSGLASGADAILVPESPVTIDLLIENLKRRHDQGANSSIVVVAEGVRMPDLTNGDSTAWSPLGGSPIGALIAREIGSRTGFETRLTVLGHVQRGGAPTTRDRMLAIRMGATSVELLHKGIANVLVGSFGEELRVGALEEVSQGNRPVPGELRDLAGLLTLI